MDGSYRMLGHSVEILAVMRDKTRLDAVRQSLDGVSAANLRVVPGRLKQVADELSKDKAPDILFIDLDLGDAGELALLTKIVREHAKDLAVIATAEDADLGGIRKLMRLGIVDFVPQPITRADVTAAMETALAKIPHKTGGSSSETGKIISFIRSCGGAGATTLAIQTAIDLAGKGKERKSVALLDLDLQFGNAGLSLDIPDRGGLSQILEAPNRLDQDFLEASMIEHASGIHVLQAPTGIVPLTALGPETVSKLLLLARGNHAFTVCDLPHAWTGWTASVLRASDRIVLVSEMSVSALQRCRRLLDLMERQDLAGIPVSIVANNVDAGWGWNDRRKEAEEALGRQFDFIVREDGKTARLARDRGVPLSTIKSGSPIVKDVRAMAQSLAEMMERQPAAATN